MGNVNFTSLNFTSAEKNKLSREIVDHLFMLKEQLEYTLSNLGMSNFNKKEIEVFTESLKVTGAVTFKDLAENSETLINGAYIKSGIFEGSIFRTFTEAKKKNNTKYYEQYGAVHMYYVPYYWPREEAVGWDGSIMGGLELDDNGDDSDNSTRINLRLYARNFASSYTDSNMYCSLKLSSEFRMSLEAKKLIYIRSLDEYIKLEAPETHITAKTIHLNAAKTIHLEADTTIFLKGAVKIDGAIVLNGKEYQ